MNLDINIHYTCRIFLALSREKRRNGKKDRRKRGEENKYLRINLKISEKMIFDFWLRSVGVRLKEFEN